MLRDIPNKREVISWCFFDFANSSFTTIIVTIVFNLYFTKVIAGGRSDADALWGRANLISQSLVLLTAPLLGAIADHSAGKKKFLFASYLLCGIFTALLMFVSPGQVFLAMMLFIIANIGYSSGENLIASFLPEIARPEDMGKISGMGWGLGYLGGLSCILLIRPLIQPGIDLQHADSVRWTNLIVALFFLMGGIPTFLWVKERKQASTLPPGMSYFSAGFNRLRETFQSIRQFQELFKFLILFGIYNCGVTTVVYFASIYADKTIGLSPNELVWLFLITQVSASAGAVLFGVIQDRIGARNTIFFTLALWIIVVIASYFSTGHITFFIVGNLAGLGLGSSQSAARAMVGLFSPVEKSGEFFGFWGLFWKLSTAIGPLVFGEISSMTGSQRTAILAVGLFFVIGFIGLFTIHEKEGIQAARAYSGKGGERHI